MAAQHRGKEIPSGQSLRDGNPTVSAVPLKLWVLGQFPEGHTSPSMQHQKVSRVHVYEAAIGFPLVNQCYEITASARLDH